EAGDRQYQVGGVRVVAVEGLGEGARPVTPPAGEDGRADLAAGGRPFPGPVLGTQLGGDVDRAVERGPALQLGVQEVAGLTADLPDALVFLGPAAGGGGRRRGPGPPGGRGGRAGLLGPPPGGAAAVRRPL